MTNARGSWTPISFHLPLAAAISFINQLQLTVAANY